jgi:hypothetical protein
MKKSVVRLVEISSEIANILSLGCTYPDRREVRICACINTKNFFVKFGLATIPNKMPTTMMIFRRCNTTIQLVLLMMMCYSSVAIQPSIKPTRRTFLFEASSAISSWLVAPTQCWGRGLVKFPCTHPLANSYHLMRAGTSMLEAEGRAIDPFGFDSLPNTDGHF